MNSIKNLEIKNIFFLISVVLVFILALGIISPFINIILISIIIVQIFYPIYENILNITKKEFIATTISVILSILFFIIPIIILSILIFRQIESLISSPNFISFVENTIRYANNDLIDSLNNFFRNLGIDQEVFRTIDINSLNLQNNLGEIGRNLGNFLFSFLNQFVNILFNLFLIIISLIFIFPNYKNLDKIISFISPLDDNLDKTLVEKFKSTIKGVIKGSFGVALLQATAVIIPLLILGIEAPLLIWLIMFILSIIPIGSGLVWFPIGVYMIINGINMQEAINIILGIGLISYSAIIINVIDSTFRPKLMKGSTNLHPLVVIFSVLGGIYLYGILGIVYGPLISVIFITIMSIYREKYLNNN